MKTIPIVTVLLFMSFNALTLSAGLAQLATVAVILTAVFIHQTKEVQR
jgi:hypothetical protein